jgi:predicted acyltransferase
MQTAVSSSFRSEPNPQQRLLSIDVMRGLIMILLAAESCMLYSSFNDLFPHGFANSMVKQFFHHPWHGLRFWDLVQPAFMTIAGAALFFSYHAKLQKGISWQQNFKHVAVRCLKLFICGTALHCVYAGKLAWELWNVLTQLSITTIIAYFMIRRSIIFEVVVSVALLLVTEFLYRFVLMPGFDQPFSEHKNFGAWMDTVLMGKINTDGWVAINFIPTAAHTIGGVVAGKLLLMNTSQADKVKKLILAGVALLFIGYGLDITSLTPIIKRISTSSFVLASAGWVFLIMAFVYWLTDIRRQTKYAWLFTVVGMNAIFIYLFFETAGIQWLNGTVSIFSNGVLFWLGIPVKVAAVISALVTLMVEWCLCYWLYKRKIFFKL